MQEQQLIDLIGTREAYSSHILSEHIAKTDWIVRDMHAFSILSYDYNHGSLEFLTFPFLSPYRLPPKQTQFEAILSSLSFKLICLMRSQGGDLIGLALSKIKDEDVTHRGFLKPLEVQLKTYKTELHEKDSRLKPTSLPAGLKIAFKESIYNNKYELQNVVPIRQGSQLQQLKDLSQDNILTLMKQKEGIELAICICMYSEDKKMLKSTLAGVAENISNLVAREKISSDKIGVFVLMDGIEKVDESVVGYFEELERMNNINLGENIAPTLSPEEIVRRSREMIPEEINEMEMKNVNNFLFDTAELEDRNERRFYSVHREYASIKNLQKNIEKMKKEKVLFDDLPNKLRPFFFAEAREEYKKEYSLNDDEAKRMGEDRLIDEYASDIRKVKPLIMRALHEGERYCQEYITSREDLAYLASFRMKVRHNITLLPKNNKAERYQQTSEQLVDEMVENEFFTYMNLFMCVKYKNSGKLSSHNWFFNGFCKELRPKYAVLLDVGLKPDGEALYKMYRYMKRNEKVGGVCGYMSLKIQKLEEDDEIKDDDVDFLTNISLKFADIQRTQQVEYHFAHLMDKPFEASFGFIHVLPGAFSAYNMKAIFDYEKENDDELLKAYFKSIDQKLKNSRIVQTDLGITTVLLRVLLPDFINSCCLNVNEESEEKMLYNENIYLAEDRILCMGIHKRNYDMAYLPDAYAEVDPIKTVHGLLGQRKRWINGSFFAFEKVKKELVDHEKQNGVECMMHVQMFYLTLMNALSYLAPAFFLFTVHIAMEAFRADVLPKVFVGIVTNPNESQFYNGFVYTMDFIYVILIMSIVFFSLHLTNGNKKFKPYLYAVSTLFGLFSIIVFAVLAVDVVRGLIDNSAFLIQNQQMAGTVPGGLVTIDALRWILVGTTGVYILPIMVYVFLFKKANILWQIIMGAFSFLFYGPTYLNILNIYSLCRIDDISWGTKGLDSAGGTNSKLKDAWKLIKFIHVAKYVFWNIIVGVIILSLGSSYTPRFFITIIMIGIMGTSLSLKIIVGIAYMIKYKLSNCLCCGNEEPPQLVERSRMQRLIESFREEIIQEITNHLQDMKAEYTNNKAGSFIQASRTKKSTQKAYQKKQKEHESKSKIVAKPLQKISLTNSRMSKPLEPIKEVDEKGSSHKKPSYKNALPPVTVPPKIDTAMSMSNSNLSDSPDKRSEDGLVPKEKNQPKRENVSLNPNTSLEAPKVPENLDNSGLAFGGFKQVQKSKSKQKKFQNKKSII